MAYQDRRRNLQRSYKRRIDSPLRDVDGKKAIISGVKMLLFLASHLQHPQ